MVRKLPKPWGSKALMWQPASHLNAGYALRHRAPRLVGRLPHPAKLRLNGFAASARLAAKQLKAPKLGSLLGQKNPLNPQPFGAAVAAPQPVIPRNGPPLFKGPPAGSAMPHIEASPLAGTNLLNAQMPKVPKMPGI
jgi:hypothetical protein